MVNANEIKTIESQTIDKDESFNHDFGHDLRAIREILGRYVIKERYMNKNAFSMTHRELAKAKGDLLVLSKQMLKIEKKLKEVVIKWVVELEKRIL